MAFLLYHNIQARETLRVMMERQKQQRLETADKLDKYSDAKHLINIYCFASMKSKQFVFKYILFFRLVDKVLSLVQSCSISLQSDSVNTNNIEMKHVSQ